jgi:hypothetical protein
VAPKDVDTTVAHTATAHGYWMGGKGHFTAAWEAAEQLLRTRPPADPGARAGTFWPIDKVIITLRSVATAQQAVGVGLGANLADGRGVGLSVDLLSPVRE